MPPPPAPFETHRNPLSARIEPAEDWFRMDSGRVALASALGCPSTSLALIAAGVGYAIVDGPRRYAGSEQAEAALEDATNRGVCERLGTPPTSNGFNACNGELAGVQQRREDRVNRRNARWN